MQFLHSSDWSGIRWSRSFHEPWASSLQYFLLMLEKKVCFHKTLGLISSGRGAKEIWLHFRASLHFHQLHRASEFPQLTCFQWHRIFQRECNNSVENLASLTAYLPLSSVLHKLCCLWMGAGQHHFLAPRDSWFLFTMSVPRQQSCFFWTDCDVIFLEGHLQIMCWFYILMNFFFFYNFKVTNNY